MLYLNNQLSEYLFEYWWHISIVVGVFILLLFIAIDLRKLMKAISTTKQLHSRAVVVDEIDAGGVILLSFDYRILGATKLFYELTGLSSINSRILTLEDIAFIFPDDKRVSSIHLLEQAIEQGEGNLELVVLSSHNEEKKLMCELFRILDSNNQVSYYVSFKLNPLVH